MIKAIACVAKDFGIGKNNGLLFNIKQDMGFFRETTKHTICCMGENTLLSFPGSKPLKNRVNVILCPEGHEYEGCICIHDFNEMVNFVKVMGKQYPVFVIGGAMFYKSMLPYYEEVYLTKVDAIDPEATAFFPNLDENPDFEIYEQSEELEENDLKFRFTFYQRKLDK